MHAIVLDNLRTKVHKIDKTIGILKERDRNSLYEKLKMKKICAWWVPRFLTADQKCMGMKISEQFLECFNKNKADFVSRFIIMDKTWIDHYTSETKQQSEQWTDAGSSAPKKAKSIPSAGKVMASLLWDDN